MVVWGLALLLALAVQGEAQEPPRRLDADELAIVIARLRQGREQCENETASLWKAVVERDKQIAELKKQLDDLTKGEKP